MSDPFDMSIAPASRPMLNTIVHAFVVSAWLAAGAMLVASFT